MARIPYAVSSPERAAFDVRITEAALARNPDGSFQAPTFLQIQRNTYKIDELPSTKPETEYFYMLQKFANLASVARFVRARRDPNALPGHDYRLTPGYSDLVENIDEDRELRDLENMALFHHLTRNHGININIQRVIEEPDLHLLAKPYLESAAKPKVHRPKTYTSRPRQVPQGQPNIEEDSRYIPIARLPKGDGLALPSYFSDAKARSLAESFAWSTDPLKYEINGDELRVAKSLAEMSVIDTTANGETTARVVYVSNVEKVRTMIEEEFALSTEDAKDLINKVQLKVPKSYGIALAVEETRGWIPKEAANTRDFVDFTRTHTIKFNDNETYPLKNLSTSSLRLVLTRGLTAQELITSDVFRTESFAVNLGGRLEALRQSNLSYI